MKRLSALAPVVLLALIAAACGDDDAGQASGAGRIQVIASFYPLEEIAARVGGDLVEVTNLTPAGAEPHDLEVTTRDVDDLEDADLVVYVGGGFQPAIDDIARRRDGPSVDMSRAIALRGRDPHFWLDPTLMAEAVDHVEAALAGVAPEHRDAFGGNAERYKRELAALHTELADAMARCERRVIVTAHAAFNYLAERYGLTQRPVAGLSPEAEPDPRRLAELVDVIRAEGVTTVFYEERTSPGVARTLAREAGVEADVLDPIETLSEDDVAAGEDYRSVMRRNLRALATALGCE